MKGGITDIKTAIRNVYKEPLYILLSLTIAILLIIFNIGITNYKLYFKFPGFDIMRKVFVGTLISLPYFSIFLLFTASILGSVLISFLVYYFKTIKRRGMVRRSSTMGIFGLIIGIIAPGCASCGIGIVTLLGFTGLMGALPFAGIELGLFGVLLLGAAIISLSTKISNRTCHIKDVSHQNVGGR